MNRYIKVDDLITGLQAADNNGIPQYTLDELVEQAEKADNETKAKEPEPEKVKEKTIGEEFREAMNEFNKRTRTSNPFPNGGIFGRSPIFDILEDFIKDLPELNHNTITLSYDPHTVKRFALEKIYAQQKVVEDFKAEFEKRYNGQPSTDIVEAVANQARKCSEANYASITNGGFPKRAKLTFVLPPSIGKCSCSACTVTSYK